MRLSDGVVQTTAGVFTPVAVGFVANAIQMMIPWLIVMFAVIITDLISGIRKSIKLGVDVSPSTAFRETMGKMVTYFAWAVMVCLVDVASGGDGGAAKWGCLLIIGIEAGSIVSNIVKPYGLDISLRGIIKVIFARSPLGISSEEADSIVKKANIRKARRKENNKWNKVRRRDDDI